MLSLSLLLFALCTHGSPVAHLQPRTYDDKQPAVSVNGDVVFVSTRTGNAYLYMTDVRGRPPQRVTSSVRAELWPAFDPSGRRIAFTIQGRGLYLLDIGANTIKQARTDIAMASFHPSGKKVVGKGAKSNVGGVAVAHLDGSAFGLRTDPVREARESGIIHQQWSDHDPVFSPDGRKIVWASRWRAWKISEVTGRKATMEGPLLFVMDASGKNKRQLSDVPGREPSFRPDGRKIVFSGYYGGIESGWPVGKRDIFIMHANGTNAKRLTRHPARDEDPVFTPNGKRIIFVSDRGGNGMRLYIMNVDGSNVRPLLQQEGRK
ncbi:MAG: PD40 domain-containing protein [Armatimonadetes bacterium]|nr:PD40 domain-containing protein [Armatimonadota bacterium]